LNRVDTVDTSTPYRLAISVTVNPSSAFNRTSSATEGVGRRSLDTATTTPSLLNKHEVGAPGGTPTGRY
jgi:hypothetical protein